MAGRHVIMDGGESNKLFTHSLFAENQRQNCEKYDYRTVISLRKHHVKWIVHKWFSAYSVGTLNRKGLVISLFFIQFDRYWWYLKSILICSIIQVVYQPTLHFYYALRTLRAKSTAVYVRVKVFANSDVMNGSTSEHVVKWYLLLCLKYRAVGR